MRDPDPDAIVVVAPGTPEEEPMVDDSYATFVLDQLAGLGGVSARRMFGAHGLYLDAVFFGIVHDGALYLKTSEASRARYREAGMEPFRPTERQTLRTYYRVPPDVLEDPDELRAWAREAVEAAARP